MDLLSDEALLNPYPYYDQIRELGPAVRLNRFDLYMSGWM